jgi:hypothetical protein
VQTGATYQWLDCDDNFSAISGETNQTFTPQNDGNYAVEITLNGCSSTSNCHNVQSASLTEQEGDIAFNLYPNPSNGMVTIESSSDFRMDFYDSKGSLVYTRMLIKGSNTIILDLNSGLYFWKGSDNHNQLKTGKLVIEK